MGLKEPTFWTLLTVREWVVTPAAIVKMTWGGTMMQEVQEAEDRPS